MKRVNRILHRFRPLVLIFYENIPHYKMLKVQVVLKYFGVNKLI